MPNDLDDYLTSQGDLFPEQPSNNGLRRFLLRLPDVPEERSFGQAWLELPKEFPENAKAIIRLPSEKVLKVPHVESDGKLCIDGGDPGPLSGVSPVDRIQYLIESFYDFFLRPWCAGELDGDFAKESQNYWVIHCHRCSSSHDAVAKIYTLDERPKSPRIYEAKHLPKKRIVIAGGDSALSNRFASAMGGGQQLCQALVAEIPISFPFTPETWPCDRVTLERLIRLRLGRDAGKFLLAKGRRNRSPLRIVIFRAPNCSFGFLLPGGPPNTIRQKYSPLVYPSLKMIPLEVERLDPNWTFGRDQQPEIVVRQNKHVLVVGAGALGSSVVELLAKAGIGFLTIIDNDRLEAANIGRHALGANSIGLFKAKALAEKLAQHWPDCVVSPEESSIQKWFQRNDLSGVDLVLDLTGEPDARVCIEKARKHHGCPLLIGWMEPYVAAAHACLLPKGQVWMIGSADRLNSLQAVTWPDDVWQHEPSCSSVFQSYTPSAATHAVALVAEAALDLLDGKIEHPVVRHWVRGQAFLDGHRPGLRFREWAKAAAPFDGISFDEPYV